MARIFYAVGRLLQLVGMIILPAAMAGQLADRLSVKAMLVVAGIGVGVFALGWVIQERVRPR